MLRALEALTKVRLRGGKPELVMVTLGTGDQPPWWRDGTTVEVMIPDSEPLAGLDFRPLVGCDVVVMALRRDERLKRIVERICAQAANVTVLSSADPNDLGHVWQRGAGWRKFCEQRAA